MAFDPEQSWMLLLFLATNFANAGPGARIGDRGHGAEVWYASLHKPGNIPPE